MDVVASLFGLAGRDEGWRGWDGGVEGVERGGALIRRRRDIALNSAPRRVLLR